MNRRHFMRGLLAMPAIVAASSLMPVRGIIMPAWPVLDDPSLLYEVDFEKLRHEMMRDFIEELRVTKFLGRIGGRAVTFSIRPPAQHQANIS